ncbi:MAG: sigma-54 dependent transcriptional regulator [Planctomycetota bacterium]
MTQPLGRILVVDDEPQLAEALRENLVRERYDVECVTAPEKALQLLKDEPFDLLLSDLMMPGMSGIQLLRAAHEIDPNLVGIIMTGQATVETAVEAMKSGAFDYLLKPFKMHGILPVLARAMTVRRLRVENVRLREYVNRLTFESQRYQIVGQSPPIQRLLELMEKVAPSDTTVLIRGATGTGKELVARALHHNSSRRQANLVTINCAALQESLFESELFGHEKGSFTGAANTKQGLIAIAEKGTLFIDEVGEMPPAMQAKLLRVLENGQYRRVGGVTEYHADVRLIAATNKPLEDAMAAGAFREDLYYRLNVVNLNLPSLHERVSDIPLLVEHFLATRQIGRTRCAIAPEAMRVMMEYRWPGNIRELANVLERAQILAENNVITIDDLPENMIVAPRTAAAPVQVDAQPAADAEISLDNLEALERRHILHVLQKFKFNKVNAARALGVSRRALYRSLEKYQIAPAAADAVNS